MDNDDGSGSGSSSSGGCTMWIILFVITLIICCVFTGLYLKPYIFKTPKSESFKNTPILYRRDRDRYLI